MIMIRMSESQAHGQTAVRVGDKTFTAEPQQVDSLSDEVKDAVKGGLLQASGLSEAQQQEIHGQVVTPDARPEQPAMKVELRQPAAGAGVPLESRLSAPAPRSGDEGQAGVPLPGMSRRK